MARLITAIVVFAGCCASAESCRSKRICAPATQQGITVSCRLEREDGKGISIQMPVRGGKILWVRFLEDRGFFRCDVATDEATYVTLFPGPRPEKVELLIAYSPSFEKRKRTFTGIWCLDAKDISPASVDDFLKEKGGLAIDGDAGRVHVVFRKGGVKIRSEMTSTYASTLECGWWPGFVVQVLFRDP